ncbi:MAG TPA: hypothetical protein VF184_07220 [Phycisphaeraceae bacterium]
MSHPQQNKMIDYPRHRLALIACSMLVSAAIWGAGCSESAPMQSEAPAAKAPIVISPATQEPMTAQAATAEPPAAQADSPSTQPDSSSASASPATAPTTQTALVPYPLDYCIVSGQELGSMGGPYEIAYNGRQIKFCCPDCEEMFREDADNYLRMLDEAASQDAAAAASKESAESAPAAGHEEPANQAGSHEHHGHHGHHEHSHEGAAPQGENHG